MPVVGELVRCISGRWMIRPSVHKAIAVGTVLLALTAASSPGYAAHTAVTDSAQTTWVPVPDALPKRATHAPDATPSPAFATVSKLINGAIAANGLPGAVVAVGQ